MDNSGATAIAFLQSETSRQAHKLSIKSCWWKCGDRTTNSNPVSNNVAGMLFAAHRVQVSFLEPTILLCF